MAKRYCALALCLALLLTAAGCGAAEPGDVRTGDTASEGVTYAFRELELPEGLTPVRAAAGGEGVLLAASSFEIVEEDGAERAKFGARLLGYDAETGAYRSLCTLETGGSPDVLVSGMAADGDIWLLISRRGEASGEVLQRLSAEGALLGEWSLELLSGDGYASGLAAASGRLCLLCQVERGAQLRVFSFESGEPELIGTEELPSDALISAGGGGVALGWQGGNGYTLADYDPAALSLGEERGTGLRMDGHLVSPSGEVYLYSSSSLYSEDGTVLTGFADCGLSSPPLCALAGGAFFVPEPCGLMEPGEGVDSRVRLVLAVTSRDEAESAYLQELAARYNRSGGAVVVELRDYTIYGEAGNELEARTRLAADMLEGRCPDLLMLEGQAARDWAGRGLLLDIGPYMDAEGAWTELLRGLGQGGGLYWLPVSWRLHMAAASSEYAAGLEGLSFAELDGIMASYPDLERAFSAGISRGEFLETALGFNAAALADWQEGNCSFDSGLFEDILRYASGQPETAVTGEGDSFGFTWDYNEAEMLSTGRQLLYVCSGEDPAGLIERQLGPDYVLCGFPGQGRGSAAEPLCPVGISAGTEYPEECWDFLRTLLQAGAGSEIPDAGDYAIYGLEPALLEIAAEAAAPYFAGERTAAEAAREAQDRASTYMAERS